MTAYYNEHDEEKAAWLRELIRRNVIAPGEVDERSIHDVRPDDLKGFRQCHFFAGIGVWSYALRLAGWEDDRPCWTGSCPCPSFSCAGKGTGFDDPRNLWPIWWPLIRESRPAEIFGEQSADAIRYGWWDLVSTDLESEAYAAAPAVLSSAGVGSPDIRHRLYFAARLADSERDGRGTDEPQRGSERRDADGRTGEAVRLADTSAGRRGADADGGQSWFGNVQRSGQHGLQPEDSRYGGRQSFTHALKGFWGTADWLFCTDGQWRPVEAGTFPLADGSAFRLGRLRGYGDAINAEVAKAFIEAYLAI